MEKPWRDNKIQLFSHGRWDANNSSMNEIARTGLSSAI
jgi:hypothetical protein